MYLRTTHRKNKDGSVIQYYQLSHSEQNPVTGNSTARIIHSFDRADQLDREALVRLCRSIARVGGLEVIDPRTRKLMKCRGKNNYLCQVGVIQPASYPITVGTMQLYQSLPLTLRTCRQAIDLSGVEGGSGRPEVL